MSVLEMASLTSRSISGVTAVENVLATCDDTSGRKSTLSNSLGSAYVSPYVRMYLSSLAIITNLLHGVGKAFSDLVT